MTCGFSIYAVKASNLMPSTTDSTDVPGDYLGTATDYHLINVAPEIQARGLEDTVYLWSDDNLSTDYFWRYLSTNDIDLVRDAKNYGRVCCFKGFDEASFSFNTLADESLFQRQFDLFRRFVDIGIDLYAYVTLTSPTSDRIVDRVRRFVDRLQTVHQNLPLRTVPLEIQVFAPVHSRVKQEQREALKVQQMAVESWCREIEDRYTLDERTSPLCR